MTADKRRISSERDRKKGEEDRGDGKRGELAAELVRRRAGKEELRWARKETRERNQRKTARKMTCVGLKAWSFIALYQNL